MKGNPNLEKNSFTTALAVSLAIWEGKGTLSTNLVNCSTIIKTYSLPLTVLGKGPRKSRCTLSIGAPAW